MLSRAFWSVVVVCVFLPGESRAQLAVGVGASAGYPTSYPYGPRVSPAWGYPGLYNGPFGPYAPPPAGRVSTFVYPTPYYNGPPGSFGGLSYSPFGYGGYGYPGFYGFGGFGYGGYGGYGFPYYSGRAGSSWSNGLSLYSAPVPVPGSVPGVFGNNDLTQQWRSTLAPGTTGFAVGISVSPRPRYIGSLRPVLEPFAGAPAAPVPVAKVGGSLVISVKVPQPATEVLLDGRPTLSTGTDRTFESPPLAAGRTGTYTLTARWVERGQVVEVTKVATGTPGEVVRVDFTK